MTTTSRVRVDAEVLSAIEDMALTGRTAAQIYPVLLDRFDESRLPTLRTVQRLVKDLRADDHSDPWTLAPAPADPEGARLVLDALADVIDQTEGSTRALPERLVRWLVAVRRAAPDLPPWYAYRVARAYQARAEGGADRSDLDVWLAYAPWRSTHNRERYERAITLGLPRAPMLVSTDIEDRTVQEVAGAALRVRAERGDLSDELRSLLLQGADLLNPDQREFEPTALEAVLPILEKLPQLQHAGKTTGGGPDVEEQADGPSGE